MYLRGRHDEKCFNYLNTEERMKHPDHSLQKKGDSSFPQFLVATAFKAISDYIYSFVSTVVCVDKYEDRRISVSTTLVLK